MFRQAASNPPHSPALNDPIQVPHAANPVAVLVAADRAYAGDLDVGTAFDVLVIHAAERDAEHLAGARFLYEPGARSYWHVHECEQAIIAAYGTGVVAWEGLDAPRVLRAGDWWHVEPGVPHWHGATTASAFAHLAVTAGGATHWLHEVSDADYRVVALG